MIDAGKLDRRLTLQTSSATAKSNAVGQPVRTWADGPTIAAQRLELRTADVAGAAGDTERADGRYAVRYRVDVTVGQRVRVDGQTYVVTQIDEPDRRRTLILTVAST